MSNRRIICSAGTRATASRWFETRSRVAHRRGRPDRRETAAFNNRGSGNHPAAAGLRLCPRSTARHMKTHHLAPASASARSPNPGCGGRAPAPTRWLRPPCRPIAAVSHRDDQSRPPTTRDDTPNHAEADARVHGEQWPCMQRDASHHRANTAMQELVFTVEIGTVSPHFPTQKSRISPWSP